MKTYRGSIQRKRLRCYLVLSRGRCRQTWVALKTCDVRVAQARAAQVAPRALEGARYLEHLVQLGEEARRALERDKSAAERDLEKSAAVVAPGESTRRWCAILRGEMDVLQVGRAGDLTAEGARQIAGRLEARYLSAPRMLAFYRRLWKGLELAGDVWPRARRVAGTRLANGKEHEAYRRLTREEVRGVVDYLRRRGAEGVAKADELADMVLLGYYTGLRLSDVAELEREEIQAGAEFLRLQPNKVRYSKRRLLVIPLVGQARACVLKRLMKIGAEEEYLFSSAARKRPTKPICAAFRACGLVKHKAMRASFHSLRATFITLMDEAGISPHLTDAITGHAGGGMHARYSQPSPQALREAVMKAIPPL